MKSSFMKCRMYKLPSGPTMCLGACFPNLLTVCTAQNLYVGGSDS